MTPREYVRGELRAVGIDPDDKHKYAELVSAKRRIAAKLREDGLSYPEIARAFGGIHHTSVMNWLGCFPHKGKVKMPKEIEPCTTWADGKHGFVIEIRGEFATTQAHVKVCACGKVVERSTYTTKTVPLEVSHDRSVRANDTGHVLPVRLRAKLGFGSRCGRADD